MGVSVVAGFWGQFFIRKLVAVLKRASLIVFILSGVIFASALTMGNPKIQIPKSLMPILTELIVWLTSKLSVSVIFLRSYRHPIEHHYDTQS